MKLSMTAISLLLVVVTVASSLLGASEASEAISQGLLPAPPAALRGRSNADSPSTSDIDNAHRFLPSNDGECRLVATASISLVHDDGLHDHDLQASDEEDFFCEFQDNTVIELDGDIDLKRELRKKLNQGQIISGKNRIKISETFYDTKTKKLRFKKNISVTSAISKLAEEDMVGNNNGKAYGNNNGKKGTIFDRNARRLADYTADKYLLIVLANFIDLPYPYSADEISGM